MGFGQSKPTDLPEVCEHLSNVMDVRTELRRVLPHICFPQGVINILIQYYIGIYIHTSGYGATLLVLHNVYDLCTRRVHYRRVRPNGITRNAINRMYAMDLRTMTCAIAYRMLDDELDIASDRDTLLKLAWNTYGPRPRRTVPTVLPSNRTRWGYHVLHNQFQIVPESDTKYDESFRTEAKNGLNTYLSLDTHVFDTEWDSYCHRTRYQGVFYAVHRPSGRSVVLAGGGYGGVCRVLDSKKRMRVIYAQTDSRKWVPKSINSFWYKFDFELQSVHLDDTSTPVCSEVPADLKLTEDWTFHPSPIVDSVFMVRGTEARLLNVNTGKTQLFNTLPENVSIRAHTQILFYESMGVMVCLRFCADSDTKNQCVVVIDFKELHIWVDRSVLIRKQINSVQWQPM